MAKRFYVETLGCPKNQVDSDKLIGTLLADGMVPTDDAAKADLEELDLRRRGRGGEANHRHGAQCCEDEVNRDRES